jgi:hypothetical protein
MVAVFACDFSLVSNLISAHMADTSCSVADNGTFVLCSAPMLHRVVGTTGEPSCADTLVCVVALLCVVLQQDERHAAADLITLLQ